MQIAEYWSQDIAKYRNDNAPRFVIQNWMRNRIILKISLDSSPGAALIKTVSKKNVYSIMKENEYENWRSSETNGTQYKQYQIL